MLLGQKMAVLHLELTAKSSSTYHNILILQTCKCQSEEIMEA